MPLWGQNMWCNFMAQSSAAYLENARKLHAVGQIQCVLLPREWRVYHHMAGKGPKGPPKPCFGGTLRMTNGRIRLGGGRDAALCKAVFGWRTQGPMQSVVQRERRAAMLKSRQRCGPRAPRTIADRRSRFSARPPMRRGARCEQNNPGWEQRRSYG